MASSVHAVLALLALLGPGAAATAQTAVLVPSDLSPGRSTTQPDAPPPGPVSITQSADPNTIHTGASAHCPVPGSQTHWWRLFDLDSDHGLSGEFCVEEIDYAIESLADTQTLTLRVHCLTEGRAFVNANLHTVGLTEVEHAASGATFHSAAVGGCCDADTEDLAIQLSTQDVGFFVGCNVLGQTECTYISASGADHCSVPEPWCIPDSVSVSHLVLVVHGASAESDGVPASSAAGMLLLTLGLAACTAWFARRAGITA